MATKEMQNEEALRRLLNRGKLELPSDDFTSRLMERIEAEPLPAKSWMPRYQLIVLFVSFVLAVLLVAFPVWSWFGFEFTPGRFFLYYAAEGFRLASVWLGEVLSHMGAMGKMMYLLPVSVAILLLVALDQALKRPSAKTSES